MRRFFSCLILFAGVATAAAGQSDRPFLCGTADLGPGPYPLPEYQRVEEQAAAGKPIYVLPVIQRGAVSVADVEAAIQDAAAIFRSSGTGIELRFPWIAYMNRATTAIAERIERSTSATWERAANDLLHAMQTSTELDAARRQYGADLVMAFVGARGPLRGWTAGLAYLPPVFDRRYGFSLTIGRPNGQTVAHELGHNLGLAHQEGERGSPPYLPHGRGYVGRDNRSVGPEGADYYLTVMATGLLTKSRYLVDRFSADGFGPSNSTYEVRIGNSETRAADAAVAVAHLVAEYEAAEPPAPEPDPTPAPEPDPAPDPGAPDHTQTVLTLHDRFRAEVSGYGFGAARVVDVDLPGDSSGIFYFFDPANAEMLVKVLDGCGINGHWWIFAAAATDQQFVLQVRDTVTGATRNHWRTAGAPAEAIADLQAFRCP